MAEGTGGSLEVVYKRPGILSHGKKLDPSSIAKNIILGTPRGIYKDVPKSTEEYLKNRYKDMPWRGKAEVYLNHSPFFRQMRRLFSSEQPMSLFSRVAFGIPTTTFAALIGKLTRADFYNPFTHSVVSHHVNPAVQMHELGHAQDIGKSKLPFLKATLSTFPVLRQAAEWRASRNAMRHFDTTEEQQEASKVLEPAFGTYMGGLFGLAALPAALVGHAHARLSDRNIFSNKPAKEKVK